MIRTRSILLVTLAVSLLHTHPAAAQYAAQGAHYPGLGGGPQAHASSTPPTGGYPAAIPLELPEPRGGLEVPLSVVHTGGPRVGEAGAGWSVPIAHVRVARTTSRRTPFLDAAQSNPALPAATRPQVFLDLGRGPQLMAQVGSSNLYQPVAHDSFLQLHENPGGTGRWRARDASGREFWFSNQHAVELDDPDLWLLVEVHDSRASEVIQLSYDVDRHAQARCTGNLMPRLPPELRLKEVRYTPALTHECRNSQYKHRIVLDYAQETYPWDNQSSRRDAGFCEVGGPLVLLCGIAPASAGP